MKRAGRSSRAFSAAGLAILLVFGIAGRVVGNKKPKFAYVANGGGNVSAYTIDSTTGVLSPVTGSPFAAGFDPILVAADPSGKFAYVANECGDAFCSGNGNVSAYTIDSTTGVLSPVTGSPFAAGLFPLSVAVDPSGKFAYVANSGSDNVSAYTIDSTTGALSPVTGSPFAAGLFPLSVAADPSGKFAYVTNGNSFNVSAYTIDSTTGALSPVPGSPFAAGTFPISVAVDPSGRFAYVANGGGNVSAYTIDSTTGALSPVPGSPFAAGVNPFSVAVDPSGRFVYVANQCGNCSQGDVSAYTIDGTTGALSPVPGSPFAAGTFPVSVAVDPSGKFAYVANECSTDCSQGNVSAYTIDSITGALSPVTGSPFAAGVAPRSVAIAGEAVVSPADLITELINTVNTLNLQPGIANSLDAKLQAVQASLAANDTITACNEMNAFIHEVMAQSGKKLTVAQADQLIAQANFIKTGLGCP